MSPLFDDTDEDVTLPRPGDRVPTRSSRELDREPADREYTLNTGVVLALFFALALLCAVFFGFGYSIGHKSAPAATTTASDSNEASSTPAINSTSSSKPSPGTVAVPEYVPSGGTTTTTTTHPPAVATTALAPRQTDGSEPTPAATVTKPAPVVRVPPATDGTASPATPSVSGTTYVQVAAVSHQEDADVLLSSLRRRGYTVLTRTDANDHLIHVQIGPFATRKDADVMRQKLLGDGYNAILK